MPKTDEESKDISTIVLCMSTEADYGCLLSFAPWLFI